MPKVRSNDRLMRDETVMPRYGRRRLKGLEVAPVLREAGYQSKEGPSLLSYPFDGQAETAKREQFLRQAETAVWKQREVAAMNNGIASSAS